ncbi:pheromone-processing carboxypeptidase KEX1-like [Ricinus communis]|nr:pheromone-processing carboxypeptidase KEX1-like [Ricinus communis]
MGDENSNNDGRREVIGTATTMGDEKRREQQQRWATGTFGDKNVGDFIDAAGDGKNTMKKENENIIPEGTGDVMAIDDENIDEAKKDDDDGDEEAEDDGNEDEKKDDDDDDDNDNDNEGDENKMMKE